MVWACAVIRPARSAELRAHVSAESCACIYLTSPFPFICLSVDILCACVLVRIFLCFVKQWSSGTKLCRV